MILAAFRLMTVGVGVVLSFAFRCFTIDLRGADLRIDFHFENETRFVRLGVRRGAVV